MQIKDELRKSLTAERREIPDFRRMKFGSQIAERVISLDEFQDSDTVLCYVSKKFEIPTDKILEYCFKYGKKIAAPVCIGGDMSFKYINGSCDLELGSFAVFEPKKNCKPAAVTDKTVCITPALCYDNNGFRIGYGGGYYDRFFAANKCVKIGICYEEFIRDFVHDENDVAVDIIVSQDKVRVIENGR